MKQINNLTNEQLLDYYKDAICDKHYNPSGESFNVSGFSLYELEEEILKRMEGE